MKDGKFTRATVHKKDLVETANGYYQHVSGEWIVIEIDCKMLFNLGIPILAQDALESSKEKQPVKCLQVFGGISTTLPGLIKQTYKMKRSHNGTFLKVVNPSDEDAMIKKEQSKESASSAATTKSRRFWQRKKN